MIAITQAAAAARLVAAGRLHAVRDPRALPDVRRGDRPGPDPALVYGAADPKAGAVHTLYRLLDDPRLNHRAEVVPGVLAEPCGEILTRFFKKQRGLGKK